MNIKHQGKVEGQLPVISNSDGSPERTRRSVFTGLLGLTVLLTLFALDLANAKANDAITYPYYFQPDANPIFRHVRSADPDAHVWPDGQMWVYASQDHVGGYANLDGYHVFSSPDLMHWTDHGEALHSRDVSWGTNGFMWAPGAAYKNNTYYLYYPHKDNADHFRIGVATSKTPEGPFKDIGHYIEGTFGTDPMCFIDDDGTAYLYFDRVVAKLNTNMVELAEKPRNIEYGAANLSKEMCDFGEGVWVFKKDGIYYFTYTNFKNRKYQGFYTMGKSPYGPFEYKGPMAPARSGRRIIIPL